MKVTKVYGHILSFIRNQEEFLLKLKTECNLERAGNLEKSYREIEISFPVEKTTMTPRGEYAQNCMSLLDEFDDTSILLEQNDNIREAYFIGKIIDSIAFDIIAQTKLTRYYEGVSEIALKTNN